MRPPALRDLHGSFSGAGAAGALDSQYRLSAPWTLTNQMIVGMMKIPNGKSHRPVQPVIGASWPSFWYIFPTSDGITKALTALTTIQTTRPSTPPSPSPVCCFISSAVL